MPYLINEDYRDARTRLQQISSEKKLNLDIQLEPKSHDSYTPDYVFNQIPAEGTVLVPGMTIVLEYSTGPEIHQVKVPNLLSLREATALEKLQENGLVGVKIEEFNADVTRGRVFQQNPDPDTLVEEGTEVTFYISLGPEPEDEPTQPTIPTETGPIGGGTTIPGGEGNTGDEGPEDGEQGNPDDSEGVTVSG